jgi:hypothetical protein
MEPPGSIFPSAFLLPPCALVFMADLILNTRLWALLCLGALGVTVLLSLLGHLVAPRIWGTSPAETAAAGRFILPIFFGLFLVIGFSALPLAANLFVSGLERMWASMGLLERPLNAKVMALVHKHHVHIVLAGWGIFVAGLVIASPYILREWAAEQPSPVSAPKGAMPPLDHQVRHAKQILLVRTDIQHGTVRYGILGLLKQTRSVVPANAPGLLEINTRSFELLGYKPAHDRQVVMFFSEPDSTGRTLFEILLPTADGTMAYPAYAAPYDPTIARTITLDELRKIAARSR